MKRMLKSRLAIGVVLALVAALVGAGTVYAGLMQWSKEIPGTVVRAPVQTLPDDAVSLYANEELTEPLTELNFEVPKWKPPLNKVLWGRQDSIPVWIKNNSQQKLVMVQPNHQVMATVNGEERHVGHVRLELPWWEPEKEPPPEERVLYPGEVLATEVGLNLEPEAPDEFSFRVVFGAAGTTEGKIPQRMLAPQKPGEG